MRRASIRSEGRREISNVRVRFGWLELLAMEDGGIAGWEGEVKLVANTPGAGLWKWEGEEAQKTGENRSATKLDQMEPLKPSRGLSWALLRSLQAILNQKTERRAAGGGRPCAALSACLSALPTTSNVYVYGVSVVPHGSSFPVRYLWYAARACHWWCGWPRWADRPMYRYFSHPKSSTSRNAPPACSRVFHTLQHSGGFLVRFSVEHSETAPPFIVGPFHEYV